MSKAVKPVNPPRLPLGEYYQMLLRGGLLAHRTPLAADLTRPVALVSCDSRQVIPGTLFVCKGAAFREDFLRDAARQGAFAYVSQQPYPDIPLPCLEVTDIRTAMGLLADLAYGHPSGALRVTGITGTKGKTTTAYYLKSILDLHLAQTGGRESALLSTIVTDDGVERRPAKLTTPEPLDLQRHLFHAVSVGAQYLTMEVSSQALKYGRVIGVDLACAIFLNIGEDHISPVEHPDWEDYFASKLRIFRQARTACVNLDSDHAQRVLEAAAACGQVVTFSQRDPGALVYAQGVHKRGDDTVFSVRTPRWQGELSIPTPGLFNVENALAAVAAGEIYGIPPQTVADGLARAFVPGRMERYTSADGKICVIVDYSHNGMSLETALRSVRREYPGRELTVLFGCTGGKGLDRREGMGRAAGELADRILLTEDDPGPEEVEDICRDIGRYITACGQTYTVEPNRERAVEQAILQAARPAVVLLAGKGCEIFQKRKNGPEPCLTDGELARRTLARYDGT
jgi:UDP-N-acetylmuramyl-tripeptide synthetase